MNIGEDTCQVSALYQVLCEEQCLVLVGIYIFVDYVNRREHVLMTYCVPDNALSSIPILPLLSILILTMTVALSSFY